MNCCNEYGQCKQGHDCPARPTPLPTLAEMLLREPCPAPSEIDLWVPTIAFFMGVAIGGGLVMTYLGWVL